MKKLVWSDALELIRILGNKEVLSNLNKVGLEVDWKTLFDTFAEGIVVERPKVGVPEVVAPVRLDSPKSIADIRQELNDLISHSSLTTIYWPTNFSKLLGIVEQIVMTLENLTATVENLPEWTYTLPLSPPYVPPYQTIIAPFPPYGGTVCSGTTERPGTATIGPMPQADGHSVSTVEDDSIPF